MVFGGFFDEPKQQRSRPSFNVKDKEFLYERQKQRCNGCKIKLPMKVLQVDHIKAFAKGGSDKPSNLQLLCGPCNASKGKGTQAQLEKKLGTQTQPKSTAKNTAAGKKTTTTTKTTTTKSAAKKKTSRPRKTNDPFADLFGI